MNPSIALLVWSTQDVVDITFVGGVPTHWRESSGNCPGELYSSCVIWQIWPFQGVPGSWVVHIYARACDSVIHANNETTACLSLFLAQYSRYW